MSVKWHKEYATGVVEIDLQHQELFSKLNEMLDAIENGENQKTMSDIFGFLDTYTRKHFAAEEGLQHQINYPHLMLHCEEHQNFLKNLERLKSRMATEGPTDPLVKLTRDTLVNWLINHICSRDKDLGDYFRAHRNAQCEKWLRSQF